jgi:hypothetical protein
VAEAPKWSRCINHVAARLPGLFHTYYPFLNDSDASSFTLALRDAFYSFPVPTDILLVDTLGASDAPPGTSRRWTLIRQDFSRRNTPVVNFHGEVAISRLHTWEELLYQVFGCESQEDLVSIQSLAFRASAPGDLRWFVNFVPYDIRDDEARYADELYRFLMHRHLELGVLFSREIDFNSVYKLDSDPPVSEDEFIKQDERLRHFINPNTGKPATIEDRHQEVAGLQLIPQVPEDVRRTFDLAKKLYILGTYEYGCFTVSQHYAYLALDAALHARWSATLGRNVRLELREKNKPVHYETVEFTSHHGLRNCCKGRGWRVEHLWVNGEQFPRSLGMVIDSLEAKGVLTRWQRRTFKGAFIQLRNSLTHLESAPIAMPNSTVLSHVAYDINCLFHQAPEPF